MPARRHPLPTALTTRPFTRPAAVATGVSGAVLRGPGVRRISRGAYVDADREPSLADDLIALLGVLPRERTAVDGVTALWCWGIEVGELRPYRFVTTVSYVSTRPSLRMRRTTQAPPQRVLGPVDALVAARLDLSLVDLVVAADWIVHAGRASLSEVRDALAAASGRMCRRAQRAATLVRERAESPQETRLRLMVVFSGLPEPECNIDLGDDIAFIGRVDLYLRAWNVAVEYEGDHHRTDPTVYANDLDRYAALAASGVLVVRITKRHMREPRRVVRRVFTALMSRGYDGPAPHVGREFHEGFES